MSQDLVLVGLISDFPEGGAVPISIGARRVVIFRVKGTLHALKNICPHMGDPLHRRRPRDGAAVCSGHGWRFHLHTGECVHGDPGARVAVYPVVVQDEKVFVRFEN